MNNGNKRKDPFNFSGFENFLKRQQAAAKAAETRRSRMTAVPTRTQPRRGMTAAAATENVNMGAAAAASNWGGEGAPVNGTNYSVARAANPLGLNERPPPRIPRRSEAPMRNNRRNNKSRRRNERSRSRSRERETTRRNNRIRKPASEVVAPGKKKSLYDQAVYILEKEAEPLAANNTKRGYQLSHYERQLREFTEFLRSNPYNVHSGVISDAIAVLQRKLGHGASSGASANMTTSSSSSASAAANSLPPGIFPKDRTIEELLRIRDYIERRPAAAGNARNRRANGARSQNFRRFLGILYDSANYHISRLGSTNDSMDAFHLHSGKQLLDELAQNLGLGSTPNRAPTPQEQAEANELVDELADALAGTSMGPAALPNNLSNL